jgi:3,4-dihydroxy 2-butanone 4-phosphate synthase
MTELALSDLDAALQALREGRFVLLHDSTARENEVDMVVAAEMVTPEHVRIMRSDAGGLLCVALGRTVGERLGLVPMHEILRSAAKNYPVLGYLDEVEAPYGGRPAFSITVNHRRTFTGVTDLDRALTIAELAKLCKIALADGVDCQDEFAKQFSAPGHVHILLEAQRSLAERRGHTELSLYLCKLAGLTPAAAICEMLDGKTHKALRAYDALAYAHSESIPVIEEKQVVASFLAHEKCN